ncbi:MAG: inorganic diphosphatase [Parcubacteria group bacterium]|nr:inorganic diphosphatase [Parcubacteria group bacterium]
MHLWHDIPLGDKAPAEFTAIIEIPRGSQNKYEINKETGLISLDRVLFGANFYPFDYGFAPQTLWDDGDALDVAVLTTNPLFSGCVVNVRPIGVMHMVDSGEGDDKVICVPTDDPRFAHIKEIGDLGEHRIKEFTHFFETYKLLNKKEVKITGIEGAAKAQEAVLKSVELYKQKFAK